MTTANLIPPFQGSDPVGDVVTQGVALGFHIAAFQAWGDGNAAPSVAGVGYPLCRPRRQERHATRRAGFHLA
jgi:hypothetical protein